MVFGVVGNDVELAYDSMVYFKILLYSAISFGVVLIAIIGIPALKLNLKRRSITANS